MPVGITTWIKQSFLGGVPFARPWTRGTAGGNGKRSGISAGRVVDGLFKGWASGKGLPKQKGKPSTAAVIARHAVSKLAARKIKPVAANVFVKLGSIRAHIDGVGKLGNTTVLIELKSTTKSLAGHNMGYKTPCNNQPRVGTHANTEYTHHMLQIGWITMAYRALHPGEQVVGLVVVAASDGAKVVMLDEAFAQPRMWQALIESKTAMAGLPAAIKKLPRFPSAGVAAAERAAGSLSGGVISAGRILTLGCGGAVVATTKRLDAVTTTDKRAMLSAVGTARPAYFVHPTPGGWKVAPLIVGSTV
jgi:hypothetical protein